MIPHYEAAMLFLSWLERWVACMCLFVGIISAGELSLYLIAIGTYLAANRLMRAAQVVERQIEQRLEEER